MGCAHEAEPLKPNHKPRSEFFYSDYDKVWRATQIAVSQYPLKANDMEKGYLETTTIESGSLFKKSHKRKRSNSAVKYSLKVNLIKGKVQGKTAVKVVIQKFKHHSTNFFSDKKKLPSDGVEEKTILYRIKRELQIEKLLDEQNSDS